MNVSVSAVLADRQGIEARPGTKVKCPFCEHRTLSIKKDDTLAKCFHPTCGRFITPFGAATAQATGLFAALEGIGWEFHRSLLALTDVPGRNAYTYCVSERGIHPRVLVDFPLGVVPETVDVASHFVAVLTEAEEALKRAQETSGKGSKERIAAAQENVKHLLAARDALAKLCEQTRGWLVFIYTDATQRVVSFRFRRPYSKSFQSFKPTSVGGCFGHGVFSIDGTPHSIATSDPLVVLEGEFNLLQLQSLCARHAEADGRAPESGYVFACAVGGVRNVDTTTIRRMCPRPVVGYDNDDDGAGEVLVERLCAEMAVDAFTTPAPESDLDSFIRSHGTDIQAAHAAVRALVESRTVRHRPIEAIKADLDDLRDLEGPRFKTYRVRRKASELIVESLRSRGTFYYDQVRSYYFMAEQKAVIELHPDDPALEPLLSRFGLAPSEPIYRHVLDALRLEALERGTRTSIHLFTHYDVRSYTLYVFDFGQGVYRIRPEGVDQVDNGTDGVLFSKRPDCVPFTVCESAPEGSPLDELIVRAAPFAAEDLTEDEQRVIYLIWFYSLFFPELFPTRPLLALVGDRGSAKSFRLRKVGRLLFGPSFNVIGLTDDAKDFDAAITNAHLVAVDNADKPVRWLEDRLAIAATGGKIPRRDYFTTNKMVEFPIRAFVALTSRTPYFRREDIADRLLLLHTRRLEVFLPEAELLAVLDERRNEVMTEVIGHLREIVAAMRAQTGKHHPTSLRMADFASFALKVAHAQGWGDRMAHILARMGQEQTRFSLEGNPIVDLLDAWLAEDGGRNVGREVTSAKLHVELGAIAQRDGLEFPYKDGRSIGQTLRFNSSALQEFFQITSRSGSGRSRHLTIRPRPTGQPSEQKKEYAHAR